MSLKDLQLPSIASLRAIAALKSTHLSQVRPARIGLGFEAAGAHQKTLADVERLLGGPGRLSLPYSLRWLLDVMSGIGVLHRTLSFVHGEVQPEHVVLGEDGVGRLVPVVRAHWVRGEERAPERLYYLAPEKLLGDRVDLRADVFSFGVLLWEAVSGQRLLEAYAVDDIIARLMSGGIPRAHAPEGESWTEPLSSIAQRAIAVDPGRRFSSIAEMKEAVDSACSRYLASTPGMVELFQDPERRVRGANRDSSGPDSQRITLPPHQAPATVRPREGSVAPAATAYDGPDEELKTRPNAAPLPSAARRPHVSTLMGTAPPFIERERDSSPHDELTTPFARVPIPPTSPVLITPLPLPPSTPVTPMVSAPLPSRKSTPLSFPPPPPNPPPTYRPPTEAPRSASLSPLIAAEPTTPISLSMSEPSFELVRPRKGRAALWLVLGAATAIGLFAARPWLSQQLAATGGDGKESAAHGATEASGAAIVTTASVSPLASADPVPNGDIGIAATPASPSAAGRPGPAWRPRGKHVIIEDTVDPSIEKLRAPVEAEKPAPPPEPAAPPPPPPPVTPEPPAEPPKSKPAGGSDADRYGI